MYTDMFNVTKGSCPYENWTSVARASCENPDHFHCLEDEYGRIGWVCTEPIWVEENRCPVFNIVANKLDTIACPKSKCPPYIYRSNKVDVEYACRYTRNSESSTTQAPSQNNEFNGHIAIIIVVLAIIFVLAAVLTGVVIFCIRRRRFFQNTNRNLGMMEVEANPDESRKLVKRAVESEHKADKSNKSFHQAKKILDEHNRLLITGVQGAGKTYLAKSLVAELGKKGKKMEKVWISNLTQLRAKQNKQSPEDIFILDEIFYELQTNSRVMETFKALQSFLESSVKKTVLITMPSYIWNKYKDTFTQARLDEVHIDLNHRNTSEKRSILRYFMKQYAISKGEADRICRAENVLLEDPDPKSIGFPALISWLCNTPSKENIKTLISHTLSAMSREVNEMKDSGDKQKRGMYLILAYMALRNRDLDVNDIDENLFGELREKFEPDYDITDVESDAEKMVINHFLLKNGNGNYEFNLNIMKKIVFVSVAEGTSTVFVQTLCENDNYLRYILSKENFEEEIKEHYSECFIKI
uniref:Uncharacterized protein LOC111109988 n=1 Tax=Crassostrea virginica TaxID=6565 RepID=A0A8B8BFH4_CRAVI|nr:uncharacterized protein LOC111109988 [Crassostrea virginica]